LELSRHIDAVSDCVSQSGFYPLIYSLEPVQMRKFLLGVLLFWSASVCAQKAEHIIIITTDGLRWQEVFGGMDSAIANNKGFNQGDSGSIFQQYWAATATERRKKLLPFFWSVLESQGSLYGNRIRKNFVNNANPYWFSYPGYNEIFTGFPDTAINSNGYPPNPHTTVLEFLHNQAAFKGRVAAFGAWEAFNRILNEDRSGMPVVAAFDHTGGKSPNSAEQLMNRMLDESHKPWHLDECLDMFTHHAALEHLKSKKPRVLYIAYGETDEWAHAGQYRDYLNAAHQVDDWIRQIWAFVQSDPQYRNKTALFITTDHGRGDAVKSEWTSHGSDITGASEIWFGVIAPGIKPGGEITKDMQLYQKQFAQTFARILGQTYKAIHPVAEELKQLWK
jgi:hypothetical protein